MMSWPKLQRFKRALKHFRTSEGLLPTADDVGMLVNERGRGAMLLDFYSPDDVLDALERYGVSPRLRDRGYRDLDVHLETADAGRQVVRVTGTKDRRRHMLGETVLRDDAFRTEEPFAGPLCGRAVRMLFLQWIRLQDPARAFSPARPPLPGQLHPGLGVGREVMNMFLGLAERLGFDGIMVCPEFAHNAVLYSREFRFFDPMAQGRHEALAGLVQVHGLARFAWGVHAGCVTDETTGEKFRWFHEEMLRATGGVVVDHLRSARYRRAAEGERRRHAYRLDAGKLADLHLPPDEPQA